MTYNAQINLTKAKAWSLIRITPVLYSMLQSLGLSQNRNQKKEVDQRKLYRSVRWEVVLKQSFTHNL